MGRGYFPMLRIAFGGIIIVLSVVCALVLEIIRMDYPCARTISVYYQLPQWILAAVGEIILFSTAAELVCLETPRGVQAVLLGLGWTSIGIGSVLATRFDNFIRAAFPATPCFIENHNCQSSRNLFFGMVVALVINFLFLAAAARLWKQPTPRRATRVSN
ncbi:uncharacterized protein LOC106159437 [Lingula anatina]|uniref:Uncharacterized protein LOC106159437 n=1 Tax=Lingula anatina TaxID=7574 RepID=A0A1S3HYS7_LINAN|nr:uncharacterized protein LOC106159437 [Lingula anatina]|eukprot:XP_013391177.1 uncharacterized protein LOC106159437 [Lingula anatina]